MKAELRTPVRFLDCFDEYLVAGHADHAYRRAAIEKIAALGYKGIEIMADVPHAWPAGLLPERKQAIRDCLAFYAWAVDEAWVGDELATPQPGRFYGGWVTSKVVGPFKGEPGTFGW